MSGSLRGSYGPDAPHPDRTLRSLPLFSFFIFAVMVAFFAAMAELPDGSSGSANYVCTRSVASRTDAASARARGWEEAMCMWGALVALHYLYMAVVSADGWPSGGRMIGVMTLAHMSM